MTQIKSEKRNWRYAMDNTKEEPFCILDIEDKKAVTGRGEKVCEHINKLEDAQLISAAPDLLSACKGAKAAFDAQGYDSKHPIVGEIYDNILNAIEKAETPLDDIPKLHCVRRMDWLNKYKFGW